MTIEFPEGTDITKKYQLLAASRVDLRTQLELGQISQEEFDRLDKSVQDQTKNLDKTPGGQKYINGSIQALDKLGVDIIQKN